MDLLTDSTFRPVRASRLLRLSNQHYRICHRDSGCSRGIQLKNKDGEECNSGKDDRLPSRFGLLTSYTQNL